MLTQNSRIAVVLPARSGLSLGGIKHLTHMLNYLSLNCSDINLTLIYPKGCLSEDDFSQYATHIVPSNDYKHKFKSIIDAVNNGNFDLVLNLVARPLSGFTPPVISIVQNIEPIQQRKYNISFLWWLRLMILRFEHKKSCRASSRIIAVSNHVRNSLVSKFQIPHEKIDVVYHGIDNSNFSIKAKPSFELPESFFFAAGSIVPYRGLEDLIQAIGIIKTREKLTPKVIIAGSSSFLSRSYQRKIKILAQRLNVSEQIIWAGNLTIQEMNWCFNKCLAFIQTSRAEACPNIVLEALSHGCLNLSCDQEPMPEIFDSGALYYETCNPNSLSNLMLRTLSGDLQPGTIERDRLVNLALNRSTFFSWSKTGENTANIFRSMLSS